MPHPFDVNKPKLLYRIGGEGALIHVPRMGGHKDGAQGRGALDADDDGGMVEAGTDGGQLHKVARFDLGDVGVDTEGADTGISREEIIEIGYARPCRGTVLQRAIIPKAISCIEFLQRFWKRCDFHLETLLSNRFLKWLGSGA